MSIKYSRSEIKHLFATFDTDGNGYLDFKEFSQLLKSYSQISESNYRFIFNLIDNDRNGKIDYKEFKRISKILFNYFLSESEKAADMEHEATFLFNLIDLDKNKTIDKEEFALMMTAIDPNVSKQTIEENFTLVDVDGNGVIDLEEFKRLCEIIFNSNN